MPEITTITSESLQAEVRRLLPSQRGFGTDLEAQNVIVPIVDLTATAEGSSLREDLQTAVNFGNLITTESSVAGETTVIDSPGFYAYQYFVNLPSSASANTFRSTLFIKRGVSPATKAVHRVNNVPGSSGLNDAEQYGKGVVFLDTNDSLRFLNTGTGVYTTVQAWPIADLNGNLINPEGFSFE